MAPRKATQQAEGKRPPGRPRKPVDEELVRKLAQAAIAQDVIARIVGIDESNLKRRFAPLLKTTKQDLAVMLRSELVAQAFNGNTAALIFANKVIGGLRENAPPEDPPGDPAQKPRGIVMHAFQPPEASADDDASRGDTARVH